jgi:hypothetical protein
MCQQEFNNKHERIVQEYIKQYPDAKKYLKEHKELTFEQQADNDDELVRIMHDRFLAGLDAAWVDYAKIDNNEIYDDHETIERDIEDEFFDETPDVARYTDGQSEYTGIQDY